MGGDLGPVGIGELFGQYPQWVEIDPVAAEMKAGAGVFISGMVAHASWAKYDDTPRRAFAIAFFASIKSLNLNLTVAALD